MVTTVFSGILEMKGRFEIVPITKVQWMKTEVKGPGKEGKTVGRGPTEGWTVLICGSNLTFEREFKRGKKVGG